MAHDLAAIVRNFAIEGHFLGAEPYGAGHIHDTYMSRFLTPGGQRRYVQQRINTYVFRRPVLVMENVERVTAHLRRKVEDAGGDPERETLNLVPTVDGAAFHRTEAGEFWRTYVFIERAHTEEQAAHPGQLYEVGRAFGRFLAQLADLPGPPLHETIPDFHNTPRRFRNFLDALKRDAANRAAAAQPEIAFALARADQTRVLSDLLAGGELPLRTTHNDTKLNNVMLDDETGRAVCVIDLDTCMPGLALYDFGDAVRIGASTAAEDERDLSAVGVDEKAFSRLARGYIDGAGDLLTPKEVEYMAFSARLLTFECGIRFLGDHLDGDVYFKTHRPGHNLDRARTQFKMVEEMEARSDQMEALIRDAAGGRSG